MVYCCVISFSALLSSSSLVPVFFNCIFPSSVVFQTAKNLFVLIRIRWTRTWNAFGISSKSISVLVRWQNTIALAISLRKCHASNYFYVPRSGCKPSTSSGVVECESRCADLALCTVCCAGLVLRLTVALDLWRYVLRRYNLRGNSRLNAIIIIYWTDRN